LKLETDELVSDTGESRWTFEGYKNNGGEYGVGGKKGRREGGESEIPYLRPH